MNIKEQQEYRAQLNRLITGLPSSPAPRAFSASTRRGLPNALNNDVGVAMDHEILAVQRGLSDEHMRAIDVSTYLASLVASSKHSKEEKAWQDAYFEVLKEVGWTIWAAANIYRYTLPTDTSVDMIAQVILRDIRCEAAEPALMRSMASVHKTPRAFSLFRSDGQSSHREGMFRLIPVPSTLAHNHMMLGAIFIQIDKLDENGLIGLLPARSPAYDRVGGGFSVRLNLNKLDMMLQIVEPALREARERLWEQIRQ